MTEHDKRREWNVAYETALGRSCGASEPTERQRHQARIEADLHVEQCVEEASLEAWRKKRYGGGE